MRHYRLTWPELPLPILDRIARFIGLRGIVADRERPDIGIVHEPKWASDEPQTLTEQLALRDLEPGAVCRHRRRTMCGRLSLDAELGDLAAQLQFNPAPGARIAPNRDIRSTDPILIIDRERAGRIVRWGRPNRYRPQQPLFNARAETVRQNPVSAATSPPAAAWSSPPAFTNGTSANAESTSAAPPAAPLPWPAFATMPTSRPPPRSAPTRRCRRCETCSAQPNGPTSAAKMTRRPARPAHPTQPRAVASDRHQQRQH